LYITALVHCLANSVHFHPKTRLDSIPRHGQCPPTDVIEKSLLIMSHCITAHKIPNVKNFEFYFSSYTGRFIMFSVITNIYNKKSKGPTLMELFTATGKLIFFSQLEMFDVCTTGDTAHIDKIFKFLPHTRQHVDACVATT
jgi:hypothetical protein